MKQWFINTEMLNIKEFNTATNTLKHNFENILNFLTVVLMPMLNHLMLKLSYLELT